MNLFKQSQGRLIFHWLRGRARSVRAARAFQCQPTFRAFRVRRAVSGAQFAQVGGQRVELRRTKFPAQFHVFRIRNAANGVREDQASHSFGKRKRKINGGESTGGGAHKMEAINLQVVHQLF